MADGFLAVPVEGAPKFLVRRPQYRLAAEIIPWDLAFYSDFGELPALLDDLGVSREGALGLELDVLPAALYLRLQNKLFPGTPLQDISPLIRRQRMVKSAYEIEQIGRAEGLGRPAPAGGDRRGGW